MTIDLSQFVDKEVTVTLRGGEEYVATIKKNDNPNTSYPFYFKHPFGGQMNYTQSGCHGYLHLDIIKIQLHETKPMTIDLEQFVGKECIITRIDDRVFESVIEKSKIDSCSYLCKLEGEWMPYTRKGFYDRFSPNTNMTIQSIRLKTPMNSPELPESTIEKLAEVLSADAVEYITGTEEYVTFMSEMLTKFVSERMGNLNPEVEAELVTTMSVNKIELRAVK